MSPRRARVATLAVAAAFIGAALYLFLTTQLRYYTDTAAYREVARAPLDSLAFWAGARPFVLPLFLRLTGSDEALTWVQLVLYSAAALSLAWAVSRQASAARLRLGGFALFLLFLLSPQLFSWTRSITTESLAASFACAGLAAAAGWISSPRSRLAPAVLALSAALFVFTRDADAWLSLFICAAAVAAALALRRPAALQRAAVALAASALLFAVASRAADVSERWRWPIVNVLGQRVLPEDEPRAFFVARGMPINRKVECLSGRWGFNCHDDLSGFGRWLDHDAKRTYASFLLHHPFETLTDPLRVVIRTLYLHQGDDRLAFYFSRPPLWHDLLGRFFIESEWSMALFGIGYTVVFFLARRRGRLGRMAPSLALLASVAPMILFVWHADAQEVPRHAILPAAFLRIALFSGVVAGIQD
jgi:hypothetical protein